MSTLDSNGILQYDETDTRGTFSELLNMGQDATSDAIGADRARLTVLEGTAATSGVTTAAFEAAPGWALNSVGARSRAGIAFWRFTFYRTGSALTVPSNGDLLDQVVATANPGWIPAYGMLYGCSNGGYGPLIGGYVNSAGEVRMTAAVPGITIPTATSSQFAMAGAYPLA